MGQNPKSVSRAPTLQLTANCSLWPRPRAPGPLFQPNQRRHPPAFAVSAIGEKTLLVGVRAVLAAMDVAHAELCEVAAGDFDQIALPASARVGAKRVRCP